MDAWAGLGYYSRAKNLHKTAIIIHTQYNGIFPHTEKELLLLPGIGTYIAAAICSIAFNTKAVVIDTNVQRVISRLYAIKTPLPQSQKEIYTHMDSLSPVNKCGDFAQAIMDLSSLICKAKNPLCKQCPVFSSCKGKNIANTLPIKVQKKKKPTKQCFIYTIINDKKEVLSYIRPESGMLANMTSLPSSEWNTNIPPHYENTPYDIEWTQIDTPVKHTFSHFHIQCIICIPSNPADINKIYMDTRNNNRFFWAKSSTLPTIFKKAYTLALDTQTKKQL